MINTKRKRKIVFREKTFYWYIKKDETGYPHIVVFSEDKKIRLNAPLIDSESIGGPRDVAELLEAYYKKCKES